jgi:hypothetical protein
VVSFKQGGDIPRFQNEGYVSDPMFAQSDSGSFTGKGLSEVMDLAQQSEKDKLMSAMTMPELQEFNRSGKIPERLRPSRATQATAPSAAPEAPPPPAAAPAAPAIAPFTMAPYKPRGIPMPTLPTEPTERELNRAVASRQAKYKEDVPFRLGYLEKEMADRAKEMAGRKESNINEALIQAGLGIMGSKSPRFLQAVSEGGTAGLRAYQQGTKDIRASEDLLRQSRIDYNKAQMLYDQGKFNEGDKARQQSIDEYKRGMERANTEDAMVTRRIATELQDRANYIADARLGLELSERPARMGLLQAQTDEARIRAKALEQGKPPTFEELTFARAEAARRLGIDKVDPKDSAQRQRIDQEAANVLRSMNRAYSPTQTAPINRGNM